MKPWFPRPLVIYIAISIALAFANSGCSAPLGPGALTPAPQVASASSVASNDPVLERQARVVTTFPLLSGSFTLNLRAPDGSVGAVKGTYTGRAVAAVPGNTTAALDMQIVETSGLGSSITGLQADGSGAFIGEGAFVLSLTFASANKFIDGAKVTLRGTSQLSCSASHLIVVTQHGTQSGPKLEVAIDLRHEVGRTGC
jgi:hypothetical protein